MNETLEQRLYRYAEGMLHHPNPITRWVHRKMYFELYFSEYLVN